jgi:hypothetical protein
VRLSLDWARRHRSPFPFSVPVIIDVFILLRLMAGSSMLFFV